MGEDNNWASYLEKDLKQMMNDAYSGVIDKKIFGGGRGSGKSYQTATAIQAAMAAKVIPTFEEEKYPDPPSSSAADSVVDDVLAKLKAGDYR